MANVPPEGIPYGKPSPGRNPIPGLPQRNNTIWQAFPRKKSHGRTPPSMANLQQHNVILGHHVRFVFGGGMKSYRWGTFTIWYFIRGKEIHGGIPFDTGFALFWQHDVSPTKTSIPYNYNQPYVSRNMSTCVVTSQLAHNQRLQVSG